MGYVPIFYIVFLLGRIINSTETWLKSTIFCAPLLAYSQHMLRYGAQKSLIFPQA